MIDYHQSVSKQPRTMLHDSNASTGISESKHEETLGQVFDTGNMPAMWLPDLINPGLEHLP